MSEPFNAQNLLKRCKVDPQKCRFVSKADGLEDYYYLRNAGENTVCLVYLHGHGSCGDQFFTRRDIAEIVLPMVREYNLSVISPNLRGNAWMCPAAVSDLYDILTENRARYGFSRYIICAGSMGGTGALIFSSLHPELIAGVGILGAATDLSRYREFCRKGSLPVHQAIYEAIDGHYRDESEYALHSVNRNYRNLTMKLCFYHGESDPVMPVSEMLSLKEQMKDVPQAEFRVVPGTHDAPLPFFREVFEKVSGLRPYRHIFEREHADAPPGSPLHAGRQGFNLFSYYQGRYFSENRSEEPMCLQAARAIRYALEQLPLDFPSDQIFFGGRETFLTPVLPEHISEDDFRKYATVTGECLSRIFRIGWDHTVPDFNRIMKSGLGDYIHRAEKYNKESPSPEREAMLISLQALSGFFLRAADFQAEKRPLEAARLRKLASAPPDNLAEALQLMWLLFLILEAQGRTHDALGRMDQYLYEAFRKDPIDHTEALNLLCHVFCKVEGLHEVTNICIGGVRPDGSDAVNELSYLILQAVDLVHSPSTNLSARVHDRSGDDFLKACIRLIATGIGFPAIMNDEIYVPSLCACGIPLEAARDYALFGCVEGNIPGRAPAWSDSFFSLPEQFLAVLAHLEEFDSYHELRDAFAEAVRAGLRKHLEEYDQKLRDYAPDRFPDPLLSALTSSCIERGKDINAGGPDFPRLHGIGMIGLATIADGLAAVKKLVFEEKRITKTELLTALRNNFENAEELRLMLINGAPKYGNDDEYVDSIAADVVRICGESVAELRTCDGGYCLGCMASNIGNIRHGKALPATPDGRFAGAPLSNAASPNTGLDRDGPTAFMNSIVTPDYSGMNCTVVNMRFSPEMFAGEDGIQRMLVLLRKFIAGRGHEIQFNVADNEVLLEAEKHPEKYGDLIVRVSGFSAVFTKLAPEVREDIIRRNVYGK